MLQKMFKSVTYIVLQLHEYITFVTNFEPTQSEISNAIRVDFPILMAYIPVCIDQPQPHLILHMLASLNKRMNPKQWD